ncbi:MAG TPA: UMP kinase, partial [Thermoproteales archaeon]|nr:UMP kinase [Thermoproteales archaeon]
MRIVIKLGGHLISTNAAIIDLGYIEKLTSVLRKVKEKHEVIVVTGGGAVSRAYIDALRRTNVNEALCDLMGIRVSRTNALLLSFMLKDLAKAVENIEELLKTDLSRKIVVMGGLQPGQSTTTTAAVVAEALGADLLIIATNVDGIYT